MSKRMVTNFSRPGFPSYEEVEEEGQAKPCVLGVAWVNTDTLATIRKHGGRRPGRKASRSMCFRSGWPRGLKAPVDNLPRRRLARLVSIPVLGVPGWERIPGLVHGFLGRGGGVSRGEWASLNVGRRTDDDPDAVAENWSRVRSRFRGVEIATMLQVHGTHVARVSDPVGRYPDTDGLATDIPGVAVGVLTADCVPVLMVAPTHGVALAVHAGWRGTLAGIAAEAVAVACRDFDLDPVQLLVALGPAIGGCCYEVDARIGAEIERRWGTMREAWHSGPERGMLDLRLVNQRILVESGVPASQVVQVGPCTACERDVYFSHRRSNGRAGRQISLVGWVGPTPNAIG